MADSIIEATRKSLAGLYEKHDLAVIKLKSAKKAGSNDLIEAATASINEIEKKIAEAETKLKDLLKTEKRVNREAEKQSGSGKSTGRRILAWGIAIIGLGILGGTVVALNRGSSGGSEIGEIANGSQQQII